MRGFWALIMVLLFTGSTPATQSFMYEVGGAPVFTMTHPMGWSIVVEKSEELVVKPDDHAAMPTLITSRPAVGQLWYGVWMCDKIDDFDGAGREVGVHVGGALLHPPCDGDDVLRAYGLRTRVRFLRNRWIGDNLRDFGVGELGCGGNKPKL